jgi:hypothetical protein
VLLFRARLGRERYWMRGLDALQIDDR